MVKSVSIRGRLTLVFVSLAALLLFLVGLLAYVGGRHYLYQAAVSELLVAAIEKEASLEQWRREREADLLALAGSPNLRREVARLRAAPPGSPQANLTRQALVEELNSWGGPGKAYTELLVIEPELGQVIASSDPLEEGLFKGDRPFFIHGRHAPYTQNLYYSLAEQGPTITTAAPVYDADGRLLAVLAGRLHLEEMRQIIARRTGLRQSDDAYLVTTARLVATPPRFLADAVVLQDFVNTEAVNRCLEHDSGVIAHRDYREIPAIIVYRWLPEQQLCLIVKIDQEEAFTPVKLFGQTLLAVGLIALGGSAAVASILARAIIRPLRELQAGVKRFSAGEWTGPLPETGRDELGLLAQDFNQMAVSLLDKESQLRRHARTLEEKVERRTAELNHHLIELRRSNAELEQFAYVASHDLQEPLRMVVSYMKLLERRYKGKLDKDADEFIQFAVDGALRMQALINDLLAYSRVNSRGGELTVTDLPRVLRQVIANLQSAIEESGAAITADPLPTLMADDSQVGQLLQNLVGNALKFRGPDAPRVHISAKREGDTWLFAVADNGIGIEAQYADRIFVIFQRLHTREDYPGTGIGLAICKKIVERHGGQLWFESQLGQGATFYFTLPAIPDAAAIGADE